MPKGIYKRKKGYKRPPFTKELRDRLSVAHKGVNMQYVKKQIPVNVEGPIVDTKMVTTAHGRVRAEAGDYIITDPVTYDTWPIKPDIFQSTYRLVPQKIKFNSEVIIKFFVLNLKHLPDLSNESRVKVEEAMRCVADELIPHSYYVCNRDEPYAQKVIDTILKGEDQKQEIINASN